MFPDTFNNFFEPEVAIAATAVLERAGFRVTIPPSAISVADARSTIKGCSTARAVRMLDTMNVLAPFVERGVKVVGLEPSCILTFRDELPALFPRLAERKRWRRIRC